MNSAKPLGSVLRGGGGGGPEARRNAPAAAAIADDNPIMACLISMAWLITLLPDILNASGAL